MALRDVAWGRYLAWGLLGSVVILLSADLEPHVLTKQLFVKRVSPIVTENSYREALESIDAQVNKDTQVILLVHRSLERELRYYLETVNNDGETYTAGVYVNARAIGLADDIIEALTASVEDDTVDLFVLASHYDTKAMSRSPLFDRLHGMGFRLRNSVFTVKGCAYFLSRQEQGE